MIRELGRVTIHDWSDIGYDRACLVHHEATEEPTLEYGWPSIAVG